MSDDPDRRHVDESGRSSANRDADGGVSLLTRLASRVARTGDDGPRCIERAITINRPVEEVFSFWRSLTKLPMAMTSLERVDVLDGRRSRWTAKRPDGTPVEWDAEIDAEEPNSLISWLPVGPVGVLHVRKVTLKRAPGGRGTEVRLSVCDEQPAGRLGAAMATLGGRHPDQLVREDLRRLKQILECGEVVRVEGQPAARSGLGQRVTGLMDRALRIGGRP